MLLMISLFILHAIPLNIDEGATPLLVVGFSSSFGPMSHTHTLFLFKTFPLFGGGQRTFERGGEPVTKHV